LFIQNNWRECVISHGTEISSIAGEQSIKEEQMIKPSAWMLLAAVAVSGLIQGCSTNRMTNTSRSAVEQMLVSNAVDQALDKVDFRPFSGHTVFLDPTYVDCTDKSYVISSVRHRIMQSGALLVDKREDAEVAVELRTGTVGTDTAESFIGVPELTLPGLVALPEIRLLTRSNQTGTAKIGIVAVDTQTLEVLGDGGMTLARSDTNNWFVAGVGPFKSGSIHREVARSTSGPAAMVRNRLPSSVVLNTPAPSIPKIEQDAGDDLQYTNIEDTLPLPPKED